MSSSSRQAVAEWWWRQAGRQAVVQVQVAAAVAAGRLDPPVAGRTSRSGGRQCRQAGARQAGGGSAGIRRESRSRLWCVMARRVSGGRPCRQARGRPSPRAGTQSGRQASPRRDSR